MVANGQIKPKRHLLSTLNCVQDEVAKLLQCSSMDSMDPSSRAVVEVSPSLQLSPGLDIPSGSVRLLQGAVAHICHEKTDLKLPLKNRKSLFLVSY
jgi:hypothetical protein